jgi:hypothetical protein
MEAKWGSWRNFTEEDLRSIPLSRLKKKDPEMIIYVGMSSKFDIKGPWHFWHLSGYRGSMPGKKR